MCKAFNRIQRNALIEDLKNILNQDELSLIQILFDAKIAAKYDNYKSRLISTDTGATQRDCASATEFTFYLAKSFETAFRSYRSSLVEHNTIQSKYSIVPPNRPKICRWLQQNID